MPLFSSHNDALPPAISTTDQPPQRNRSLFARNRSTSPPSATRTIDQPPQQNRSLFSRNRSTSPPADSRSTSTAGSSTRGGGFFGSMRSSTSDPSLDQTKHNTSRDPSIGAARMKVADAEAAEKAADEALIRARSAVKAAREHVKILENEATEDARRAKAKQAEAKNVSKSARGLGRHG